jgi:hypothetical protein
MRVRSWMAALALVVGTSIAVGRAMPVLMTNQAPDQGKAEGTEKVKSRSESKTPKPSGTRVPSVQLNLVIAGLGSEGCDVQVKPGNSSCKFSPIYEKRGETRQFVPQEGRASLELRDVELRGAERTILVAVTIRESGQAERTFYRGFRLTTKREVKAANAPAAPPAFTCYLSSPSKLAKADESRTRR